MRNKRATVTAYYGLLIALSFILSYVESAAAIPFPIPGMKLGLANLVTIVGLYTVGIAGTVVVSFIRIVLTGFTFGNLSMMMYSLAGWALSILTMILLKKYKVFDISGISIAGGVMHNIGQICMAALVVQTAGVFIYLPFLMVAGMIAGTVIGLLGGMIVKRIQKNISRGINNDIRSSK